MQIYNRQLNRVTCSKYTGLKIILLITHSLYDILTQVKFHWWICDPKILGKKYHIITMQQSSYFSHPNCNVYSNTVPRKSGSKFLLGSRNEQKALYEIMQSRCNYIFVVSRIFLQRTLSLKWRTCCVFFKPNWKHNP